MRIHRDVPAILDAEPPPDDRRVRTKQRVDFRRLHRYRLARTRQVADHPAQAGRHVVELRPADCDKGTAIAAMLEEPPFRGRVPVFAGDDLTDESGFAVVNARGGLSVLVGTREPSAAHYALRSPRAVRRWLATEAPA